MRTLSAWQNAVAGSRRKKMMNDLRRIPSIDSLLNSDEAISLIHDYGRDQVLFSLRHVLDELRTRSKLKEDNFSKKFIFEQTKAKLINVFSPTLISVINATGVILHTNLGRAPLSNETIQSMQTIGSSYNTLEYDLVNGKRGSRSIHAEEILKQLTGAESATIVNNNASAVLLVLSSLANRKKVVISRTQLIEIGGGFRIPDVMKQSGAKLIEIGTTNRVHLRDYEEALQQPA
ncbi:MAG: L-seryl-tRNA(Sec) selenium transferase, partial [Anaerolineaceae bacterium]|nr:L-seryl-tRNA(Sec) selenium transferase [Anaerolineaceae bacterium]